MRRELAVVLAVTLTLACVGEARAQTRGQAQRAMTDAQAERVEALAQAASELVRAGDFHGAISRFQEAYRLGPAAALLYNIAFVYDRKLGDASQARIYYQRYLAAPDADTEGLKRAQRRLAELRAAEPAPAATPPTYEVPPQAMGSETGDGDVRLAFIDPPARNTTAWAFMGVGMVTMVAAGGFLHMAGNTADQANTAQEPDRTILAARKDDQELIAWSLLGGGAASAVTGVVLLLLDDGDETAIRLGPAVAPGLAGLRLEGRW